MFFKKFYFESATQTMSHLISAPTDISILKAYWVNHGVDYSDPTSIEFSKDPQQKKSNKRQGIINYN